MTPLSFERVASGTRRSDPEATLGFQDGLGSQSEAELSRLLGREILGKLLQHLVLQRLVDHVLRSQTMELSEALADLAGTKGAAHAVAELPLRAHRLLRPLLRRQVLHKLLQSLQRLRGLDRLHGLSCRDLLGELDGRQRLGRILHLQLRPKRIQLREILCCPRVL